MQKINKSVFSLLTSMFLFVMLLYTGAFLDMNSVAGKEANSALHQSGSIESTPIADTYITSQKPSTSHEAATTFWVGHNNSNSDGTQFSLLKFDLNAIKAGRHIKSAKLILTIVATTKDDPSMDISVTRLIGDWSENITWNQYNEKVQGNALSEETGTSESIPVSSVLNSKHTWDLTKQLQNWANDPNFSRNFAIVIKGYDGSEEHERAFRSKDCGQTDCTSSPGPKLVIEYDEPSSVDLQLNYSIERSGSTTLPGGPVTVRVRYIVGQQPIQNLTISNTLTGTFTIVDHKEGTVIGNTIFWEQNEQNAKTAMDLKYIVRNTAIDSAQTGDLLASHVENSEYVFTANMPDISTSKPACYNWDFGDESEHHQEQNLSATDYTYDKPGEYVVTVVASQEPSYLALASTTVTVTNELIGESTSVNKLASVLQSSAPCTLNWMQSPIFVQAIAAWEYGNAFHKSGANISLINPKLILFLPAVGQDGQFQK